MTGIVFTRWLMGIPQLLLGAFFCWLWAEFRQYEFYGLAVFFIVWGVCSHAFTIKVWRDAFIDDVRPPAKS